MKDGADKFLFINDEGEEDKEEASAALDEPEEAVKSADTSPVLEGTSGPALHEPEEVVKSADASPVLEGTSGLVAAKDMSPAVA